MDTKWRTLPRNIWKLQLSVGNRLMIWNRYINKANIITSGRETLEAIHWLNQTTTTNKSVSENTSLNTLYII